MKFPLNAENTIHLDLATIILALPSLIIVPVTLYVIYLSYKGIKTKVPGSKLIFWGLIGHIAISFLSGFLIGLGFSEIQENTQLIVVAPITYGPMLILIIPVIGFKRMINNYKLKP